MRVYGAQLTDITDRSTRDLGVVSGRRHSTDIAHPIRLTHGYSVAVGEMPWWIHHGGHYPYLVDDFEGTLKWRQNSGTISKAADQSYVHDGSYAMKMVTAATAGSIAEAWWRGPGMRTDPTYYCLELWWALSAASQDTPREFAVMWEIEDRERGEATRFGFRYWNYDTGVAKNKLQYWTSAGAWADLHIIPYYIDITLPQWHYLLFVLRNSGGTERFRYYYMNMDTRAVYVPTADGEAYTYSRPRTDVTIYCSTDAAAATTAYVDDFGLWAGTSMV